MMVAEPFLRILKLEISGIRKADSSTWEAAPLPPLEEKISVNWRFRVPDDEEIHFEDTRCGRQAAISGRE